MSFDLKPAEIRVLGVLIEKSLAQPAHYPMTLNALKAACNQKSNRDPVTDYSESEISAAVASLRRQGLVDQAEPDRSSRAVRFQHEVDAKFDWNAAQRALMAELMIRGPQTLGELRSRASRMTRLESTDYGRELLGELERAEPPLVVELQREPGRSARRFAQLLGGEVTLPASAGEAIDAAPEVASPSDPGLTNRVQKLEEEIANLQASMAGLRDDLRRQGILSEELE